MSVVLDASALLAVILEEPGADAVLPVLRNSEMSAVNLSEVYAKLLERGVALEAAEAQVARFELRVRQFGEANALRAAALRPLTKEYGLSFGDRACLAQGELSDLPVMTGDRDWAKLDIGVEIILIR